VVPRPRRAHGPARRGGDSRPPRADLAPLESLQGGGARRGRPSHRPRARSRRAGSAGRGPPPGRPLSRGPPSSPPGRQPPPATSSDPAGGRAELEIEAGPGAPPSAPEAGILELARSLLDAGRAEAEGRRRRHWEWAGAGLAGATAVAVAERAVPRLTRRGFLHAGLQGAALLALASTGVCSLLAERFEPSEIRAFRDLSAGLASLAAARA